MSNFEPIENLLWVTSVSAHCIGAQGAAIDPVAGLSVHVDDKETGEHRIIELAIPYAEALLILQGLSSSLVELCVVTCNDPECMIHGHLRRN